MEKITKSFIKRVVVCANKTPRMQFRNHFSKEIGEFTEALFKDYKHYAKLKGTKYNREGLSKLYIYTCMQNLISAFNIFICGYPIPAGNLMRHFHESVAWAILFSTKELDFYEKFKKNKNSINFNTGPGLVKQHIDKFNINKKGWETFMKKRNFYHNPSHSTAFAVSSNFIFSKKSTMAFGSHFDKKKLPMYKKEITTMISAANILENLIVGITQQIKEENKNL